MEYYDYNRICDDAVINTITMRVIDALKVQMEKMKEEQETPYIQGIDGLARYLGIGAYWSKLVHRIGAID